MIKLPLNRSEDLAIPSIPHQLLKKMSTSLPIFSITGAKGNSSPTLMVQPKPSELSSQARHLVFSKVRISRVLERPYQPIYNRMEGTLPQPKEPLDFLFIVQRKHASERSKIVVERSLESAATSMFHEAMNGFSVVFTNVLLRSDMHQLFSNKKTGKFSFKKMLDIATLSSFSGSKESQVTGMLDILC